MTDHMYFPELLNKTINEKIIDFKDLKVGDYFYRKALPTSNYYIFKVMDVRTFEFYGDTHTFVRAILNNGNYRNLTDTFIMDKVTVIHASNDYP